MSEKQVETVALSATTFEERTASSMSMTDDEVFYSTQNSDDAGVHLQGYQRCSSDVSDQTITHRLDAYPHSVSAGAIDQLACEPYMVHKRLPNDDEVTYRQNIAVRYLQPPTPPRPGPIIIREIRPPAPPEEPPLVIHQQPPISLTPPPIVIRERPPLPPPVEPPCVINKYLPAPPPPPRKVIVQRQAPLPQKPQSIIIEKWLPYKPPPKRRVVIERAPPLPMIARQPQISTVITQRPPRVNVVQNIQHLGTVRVDPRMYSAQYGTQLSSSEYVRNMMSRFGIGNNYSRMAHLQAGPHSSAWDDCRFQTIESYLGKQQTKADDQWVPWDVDQSSEEGHAEFIDEPMTPNEELLSSSHTDTNAQMN